eukprot:2374425-Alexandrium_andersonii.AAC.1
MPTPAWPVRHSLPSPHVLNTYRAGVLQVLVQYAGLEGVHLGGCDEGRRRRWGVVHVGGGVEGIRRRVGEA